jgi:hypothetical protein
MWRRSEMCSVHTKRTGTRYAARKDGLEAWGRLMSPIVRDCIAVKDQVSGGEMRKQGSEETRGCLRGQSKAARKINPQI